MDTLYRGIETSLLTLSFALGIGAVAISATPTRAPARAEVAVTLPLLAVTADPPRTQRPAP